MPTLKKDCSQPVEIPCHLIVILFWHGRSRFQNRMLLPNTFRSGSTCWPDQTCRHWHKTLLGHNRLPDRKSVVFFVGVRDCVIRFLPSLACWLLRCCCRDASWGGRCGCWPRGPSSTAGRDWVGNEATVGSWSDWRLAIWAAVAAFWAWNHETTAIIREQKIVQKP